MLQGIGRKLLSQIYKTVFQQQREILKEELKREVVAELMEVVNPSDEIGWRVYDFLEENGIMANGNILLNEEVDEITFMVKDYIIEKIEGSDQGDDTIN